MRKKVEDYAIGLDIGTNSVGWAAIDCDYKLVKVNGRDAWGVVLFESAKTAKDRRLSRSGRRRLERRRMRIRLLQELMAEGIEPVDPNFYIRLKESSYHVGEGKYFRSNHFNLFDGGEYTDAQYFHEYPTIYHLRKRLVENKEKADIRLVYLAIHHIIKYRGHFLNEGGMDSVGGSPEEAAKELFDLLCDNYDKDLHYAEGDKIKRFVDALLNDRDNRSKRQEAAYKVLTTEKKDKFVTALTKAVTGLKTDLTDLLCIEDSEEALKDKKDKPIMVCFTDAEYEAKKESEYYTLDRADILVAVEKLYAAVALNTVLRGKKLLCEAMVDKFRKHAEDLAAIRKLIRGMGDKALYNDFFRKGKGANYTGYIGDKRYGIYVAKEKKKKEDGQSSKYCDYERPGKENLYKRIREILNKAPDSKEKEYIEKEIIKEDFLPLITSKDNAYIPYQLNLKELDAILENQGKFYPCLAENADKIRALLTFRRPYYVGTLKGDFSWAKEIDLPDEKITPWNFYKQLDGKLDDIAEKFISRMTNDCTLIKGESALPLNSMLYQKYVLLNEINKIKVFDKPISVEWKQAIYELCKSQKTVKKQDIVHLLKTRTKTRIDMHATADNIGGLSDEKKLTASLSTYVDFVKMFGEEFVKANFDALEEVVRILTIFNDTDIRKKRIKELKVFEGFEERLAKKNFSGWGKYSRKAIYVTLGNNGKCVLDIMYETNKHFNEILYDEDLGFKDKFINNEEPIEKLEYKLVDEMHISPAVKRSVWNAVRLAEEFVKQAGHEPTYIFLEETKGPGDKTRTKSKYDKVNDLYKAIKDGAYEDILQDCKEQLAEYKDKKKELDKDKDKLYLWFIQLGRSMYSEKAITIDKLSECEIDHIIPRSLIVDNSIENRVLVCKGENQTKGERPLTTDIVKKMRPFWEYLYRHKLIGSKKFTNLQKTEFTDADMKGFINRQLVETGYTISLVKALLKRRFPKADIRGVKSRLSSTIRNRFAAEGKAGFYKIRGMNNFHHAKDAYLAAAAGLFTTYSCPLWGNSDYNKALNYYMKHMDESRYKHTSPLVNKRYGFIVNLMTQTERPDLIALDEESGEYLWDTNRYNNLLEMMARNTCNVVKTKLRKAESSFYNQSLFSPNSSLKGLIPQKCGEGVPMPPDLYGGYSNEYAEYFVIVRIREQKKKGGIKETLELKKVPVRISINGKAAVKEYIKSLYSAEAEVEIIRPVYKFQLIRYRKKPGERGQLCYIVGESELHNAEEVYFNSKFDKLLYLCNRHEKNIEEVEKEFENDKGIDYLQLMKEFVAHYCYVVRLKMPLYENFAQLLTNAVEDGRYELLTVKEKAELINHMLTVSMAGKERAKLNAKLGGKEVGRLADRTIAPAVVDWIDMSLTGLYVHTEKGLK